MSHAKISTQVDIVAHTVASLGFTPKSSVALQLLDGVKVLASLRVDVANGQGAVSWAQQVTNVVQRIGQVTGVILISFEDERAMTVSQFEELGDQLAHIGAPIRRAILVTGGMVMDYEGDSTDAQPWDAVQISPIGLETHLQHTKPAMSMANIPAYDNRLQIEVREQAEALRGYQFESSTDRKVLHAQFTTLANEYQSTGQVTDQMIIWVAGAMHAKMTRDLVAASTASTSMSLESITSVLIGDTAVEDREFFDHAIEMLYQCAHFVQGEAFANILCVLGWASWTIGQGSESQKFLARARTESPGHRLGELLTMLATRGKVSATALINPYN